MTFTRNSTIDVRDAAGKYRLAPMESLATVGGGFKGSSTSVGLTATIQSKILLMRVSRKIRKFQVSFKVNSISTTEIKS